MRNLASALFPERDSSLRSESQRSNRFFSILLVRPAGGAPPDLRSVGSVRISETPANVTQRIFPGRIQQLRTNLLTNEDGVVRWQRCPG